MASAAVCSVHGAPRPHVAARQPAASSSSGRCATRQPWLAARCATRAQRRLQRAPLPPAAASEELEEVEVEVEVEEEVDPDETVWQMMQRAAEQEVEGHSGRVQNVLRVSQQKGLVAWQPAGAAPAQQAAEEFASSRQESGVDARDLTYEQLMQLPGLQRQLRAAAQERSGLPPMPTEQLEDDEVIEPDYDRMPRKAEPVLDEWDLRAKMEKRRRQERQMEAWKDRKSEVGMYPSLGADWRTDIRCRETGNPTDPVYREWTQKEIWDLITLNGRNADPRTVTVFVRDPEEIADIPAQGGQYHMSAEEYFESLGRLIQEDEVALIVDKDSEVALLTAEFSDFDDELLPGSDYDSDYAAAGAGAEADGDDF